MTDSDLVRAYAVRVYVKPARARKQKKFSVRSGDVHAALGFDNRFPLVCGALGTQKFRRENGLKLLLLDGPTQGANTVLTFGL